MVGGEFFAGAETPEYTGCADTGIEAGLHVGVGVADVKDFVQFYVRGGGHGLADDGGVGFDGLAFALAEDFDEAVFFEEDADQFFGAVLVFVGGEGEADAGLVEAVHHVHDAGVGTGAVADVGIIPG